MSAVGDRAQTAGPGRPPPIQAPEGYKPELDGLRFLAFLVVFVHHALPNGAAEWVRYVGPAAGLAAGLARAGRFGVDLFFVLSSYLITALLQRELAQTGTLSIGAFYVRRCLRIWPLYFAFVFAVFAVDLRWGGGALLRVYGPGFLTFTGNWSIVRHGFPDSALGILWSISVEEQFYLLWPPLLLLVGPRRMVPTALLLWAAGFAARAVMVAGGAPFQVTWCSSFSHLDAIALGVLAAARPPQRQGWMAPAGAAVMALSPWLLAGSPALEVLLGYPLEMGGAFLVVVGAGGSRLLARPALVWLGRVSYGLYVFHQLVLRTVVGLTGMPFALRTLLSFALTVLLAALSYTFLESPFLRLKRRFSVVESRPGG